MPNLLKERPYFQPNKNALVQWLGTRKSKKPMHGYNLPGFFSTHGFFWDVLFSLSGFAIEIGIFIFFMSLVKMDDISNWIIFPIIIILDIIIIVFMVHTNKASKIKYENAILFLQEKQNPLVPQDNISRDAQLKEIFKLDRNNALSSFGILFELFACCLKIYYIHAAYELSFEPISIGIVIGYIVQTFFYIYSGGYFIAELGLLMFISNQYKKYDTKKNDVYMATQIDDLFNTQIELEPKKNLIFELVINPQNSNEKYSISCNGVPLDDDIMQFASMQSNNEARKQVMYQAHKLQLKKFSSL